MDIYLIIDILSIALEFSLFIWINSVFFEFKIKYKFIYIILGIILNYFLLIFVSQFPLIIKMILMTCFYIIISLFFFYGKNSHKIILACIYGFFFILMDILFFQISSHFYANIFSNNHASFVWQISSRLIIAAIIGFIALFISMKKAGKVYYSSLISFLLIPLSNAVMLITLFQNSSTNSSLLQFVIWAFISIVTFCILAINVIYRITAIATEARIRYAEKEIKLQNEYFHEIEQVQSDTLMNLHDMNHHIKALRSLVNKQKIQLAEEYLNNLENDFQEKVGIAQKDNITLYALLNEWKESAEQNDINVVFNIQLSTNFSFPLMDLSIIISNTFSNAIEACNQITNLNIKREIICDIWQKQDILFYKIKNSIQYTPNKHIDKYISTKKYSGLHGIGLLSVEKITEKYQGVFLADHDSNFFYVTISLVNPG